MTLQKFPMFFVLLLSLPITFGCASFGERHLKVRAQFERGELEKAKSSIDERLKKNRRGEADLLKLNKSIIELCSGNSAESEKLLREVRDNFEANEKTSVGEGVLSMITDDNAVSYVGEDYEKVLIRVFLALSNLMHDGTDAPAYAHQVVQKQNDIIRAGGVKNPRNPEELVNLKESYRQVALAPYLIGAMRESTFRDYDEVRRAYQTVCQWEPNFSQGPHDLRRAQTGAHTQKGHGAVYVIGLVGGGPYKLQRNCEVLQSAQIWTTAILAMSGDGTVIPDFSPIMLPVIVRPRETVPALAVSIDDRRTGVTETITDVGRMAEEQFEAVYPQILAKAVARRAMKKIALYGVKSAVDTDNVWAHLLLEVGAMAWQSSETADTRCWNLLPAEIQVVRLEVPAGDHKITLQPTDRIFSTAAAGYISTQDSAPFGQEYSRTISVEDGRNTYVLANFPGAHMIGKIVASNDARYGTTETSRNATLAP